MGDIYVHDTIKNHAVFLHQKDLINVVFFFFYSLVRAQLKPRLQCSTSLSFPEVYPY